MTIEETPLKGQDLAEIEAPQTVVEENGNETSAAVQIPESAADASVEEAPSTETEASKPPPKAKKPKNKRAKGSRREKETKGKDKYYIPVEVGQELIGRIKTITDFGAFVDLKLTVDGLVHISQMSRRRVDNVTDVVSPGDEVTVWVKNVNRERGRVGLTMLKPLRYKYKDISEGDALDGEIKRIENYGVFVDVGLEREGLVHVSELSHEYVKSPEEAVTVGDEVKVQVLKIDARKKQVNLSIKALLDPPELEVAEEIAGEEPEEAFVMEEEAPMSTTMAAAFGKLDTFKKPSRKKRRAPKKRKRNRTMDRLVSRTLQVGQQE